MRSLAGKYLNPRGGQPGIRTMGGYLVAGPYRTGKGGVRLNRFAWDIKRMGFS